MGKRTIPKKRIKRSRIKRSKSKRYSKNKRQKRTLRKKYKGGRPGSTSTVVPRLIGKLGSRVYDRMFLNKEERDQKRYYRRLQRDKRNRIKREEIEERERIESEKKSNIDVWFRNTKASSIPGESLKCIPPSYFTKEEVNEYLADLKSWREHGVIELLQDSYDLKFFEYNRPTRYLIRSYWPYSADEFSRYDWKYSDIGRSQNECLRDMMFAKQSNRELRWSELKKLDYGIQSWLKSWTENKKELNVTDAPHLFCLPLADSDNCHGRIVNINNYFNQMFFLEKKWSIVTQDILMKVFAQHNFPEYMTIERSIITNIKG